ncbi:MAG: YiiD C-terminal domain-containing protein [Candidatus Thiodiazotropha sp.]
MITARELEQRIRSGIPIAAHMDFQVRELSDNAITVIGGGAENVNVHGTAFAGSLYAITTLALWGLVHARLPADSALVLAEGSIRYRRPVVGDIVARCEIPAAEMAGFLARLQERGKAVLVASVQVAGAEGVAAEYQGTVHARLQQASPT